MHIIESSVIQIGAGAKLASQNLGSFFVVGSTYSSVGEDSKLCKGRKVLVYPPMIRFVKQVSATVATVWGEIRDSYAAQSFRLTVMINNIIAFEGPVADWPAPGAVLTGNADPGTTVNSGHAKVSNGGWPLGLPAYDPMGDAVVTAFLETSIAYTTEQTMQVALDVPCQALN